MTVNVPCSRFYVPLLGALLSISCVALHQSDCSAALLSPGTTVFDNITSLAIDAPSGTNLQLLDSLAAPYVSSTLQGIATTEVFAGDENNPYGLDRLTFVLTISNDIGAAHSIGRVTATGFEDFLTEAGFAFPTTGIAPGFVSRDASGGVIGFAFFDSPVGYGFVAPGSTTSQLVVRTNATGYQPSMLSVINGSTAQVASFSPIPEPAAAVTGSIAALITFAVFQRRRQK